MQDFGSGDTSSNLVGGIVSAFLLYQRAEREYVITTIHLRLRIYVSILLVVAAVGILGMMAIEHLSFLDAVYFIVVTIATVGFGDIHPVTPYGKILVIGIILIGVGCFVGLAANVIELMIDERERDMRMRNLNMLVGVFFSEVGTRLLRQFSAVDPVVDEIRSALIVSDNWSEADFARAQAVVHQHENRLDSRTIRLPELREFLTQQKGLMLSLLENPQIIEQEGFTPLLQAVFHLIEELAARDQLTTLPGADYHHLSGDINRVYGLLTKEWLTYMKHLKKNYPYLFSLAMRTNPFDVHASPVVR